MRARVADTGANMGGTTVPFSQPRISRPTRRDMVRPLMLVDFRLDSRRVLRQRGCAPDRPVTMPPQPWEQDMAKGHGFLNATSWAQRCWCSTAVDFP